MLKGAVSRDKTGAQKAPSRNFNLVLKMQCRSYSRSKNRLKISTLLMYRAWGDALTLVGIISQQRMAHSQVYKRPGITHRPHERTVCYSSSEILSSMILASDEGGAKNRFFETDRSIRTSATDVHRRARLTRRRQYRLFLLCTETTSLARDSGNGNTFR